MSNERSSTRTIFSGKSTLGVLAPRLMAIQSSCGVAVENSCIRRALSRATTKSVPRATRTSTSGIVLPLAPLFIYTPRDTRSSSPVSTICASRHLGNPQSAASFAVNILSGILPISTKRHYFMISDDALSTVMPSLSVRTHLGVVKRRLVRRIRLIRKQVIRRIVYGHRYTSKTRKSEDQ